ncbi:SGNH/GDSL hydrolase family protein [Candidatus Roizmanbacteria bacterium]|nr:SGNH/GDSL hydrolase family protein [Candidatus Roizmanbacteria bacterium]
MKIKNTFIWIIFLIFGVISFVFYLNTNKPKVKTGMIKYVAIGDSYTIGLGVDEKDSWPNILTNHLKEEGIDIDLVANPAVSGYLVRHAIESELPIVEKIKPDLVTVLIGANDSFGRKEATVYHKELIDLLDRLQPLLTNPKNIVLLTIPDYTVSVAYREYEKAEFSELIGEYNQVIKEETDKRGLKVADIFPVSQTMNKKEDYVFDGLHPSAQSYDRWESAIFPVVRSLFP